MNPATPPTAPDAPGTPAAQGSEEEHSPTSPSQEGTGSEPESESGNYYTGGNQRPGGTPEAGETPEDESAYLEGALVTAGAVAAENSDPDTAAGASAPLSKPALESAPQGEDGPLISEADPTSNAG